MKKFFLLFTLAVSFFVAMQAQTSYQPVPFDLNNSVWYEYYVDMEAYENKSAKGNYYHYVQYTLDSINTDFAGKQYRRIILHENGLSVPTYVYLREDTLNRRIYLFTYRDHLLYDFSANVGDTIKTISDDYIVRSVDSVLLGGKLRKRLNFNGLSRTEVWFPSGIGNYQQDVAWIEGIGSTEGLLFPFFFTSITDGVANALVCYSNGDSVIYHNTHFTDCMPTSFITSPEVTPSITAYPNPAKDRITFDFGGAQFEKLQVINTAGVVVREVRLGGQTHYSLPLQGLPAGVYVYRLQNGETATQGKFVVEN